MSHIILSEKILDFDLACYEGVKKISLSTFSPEVRPKTTSPNVTVKTKGNSFGDGYEQNIVDGLNPVREEVSLSWPVLTFAQAEAIHDFFKGLQGAPFLWALPNEDAKKWRCVEWSRPFECGHCSMTAKFKEVFA